MEAEPVVGPIGQLIDAVALKELPVESSTRGFPSSGFRAILAKLGERGAIVRVGPGAAGAVEAIDLVHLAEDANRGRQPMAVQVHVRE